MSKQVFVIYYSMYGHVHTLAKHICKGLEKSGGWNFIQKKKFFFYLKFGSIKSF